MNFEFFRGEEVFQPELISNPYIQRMFQVCILTFPALPYLD